MPASYLAIDIGASSGRHILGRMENGRLVLEEIYRFENRQVRRGGHDCWDPDALWQGVLEGLKECGRRRVFPASVGIDTWAVDFALLDEDDRLIGDLVSYRDGRTAGADVLVEQRISASRLYARTGIQKQPFNTIYQLAALQAQAPDQLARAASLLMIPDFLNFRLTGIKKQEYTNATTTQLVNPETKEWDMELIGMLGYPAEWFGPLSMPGTLVGSLKDEIAKEVGFQCQVVLPATHDTGSAVMAVPSNEDDVLYISSGTWSLMGTERMEADCSMESMKRNFTNEGGYDYRFRYLKNIMGLWMIQSVKKELAAAGQDYSFAQLCSMASEETIPSLVDCNDDCFLAPESMTEAVREFCRKKGEPVPETAAALASVIYNSLAKCYGETVEELEQVTGKKYGQVHIVGGGANADYLNRLTAAYTGRPVYAGPTEATAIGNLAAQMIRAGEYADLKAAREGIFHSFDIKEYR